MKLGCWLAAALFLLRPVPAGSELEALTPARVVERLQQRFSRIHDYECVIHSETRYGARVEAMAFRLWYRTPGLLRLRVLRGRHQGSELLLDARGVLRGRRGGLLKPFSRRLDRSDSSLRSLRGQPAWELDFGSFLRAMRERMTLPGSVSTVRPATGVDPRLILEVRYRPVADAHLLRDVWAIDPGEWLLSSGDVYDGTTRVDHVEFSELRLDAGLKESWFRF